MLNICLTFDHEIYFGENYFPEEEILFKPTYRLMDVLNANDTGGTFFTDVCSVFKYQSLGLNDYPEQMAAQLRDLIAHGQDVQLHIHSHWYKSEYNGGKWKFDDNTFRIHAFGFDEGTPETLSAGKIIRDGKAYLESTLRSVDSSYQCIAFRAGGFCLQPEAELLKVLKANGITIDSSIAKNLHSDTALHYYSFMDMPREINWWKNPETGIGTAAAQGGGNIFEVPIGTLKKKPVKWWLSKRNIPFNPSVKRGTYFPLPQSRIGRLQKIKNRLHGLWSNALTLSLDSYRGNVLAGMVKEFLKDYDCRNYDQYIAVICHPKIMSDDHIRNMDAFIKEVKATIPLAQFVTMRDVHQNITGS
jgi:hypothetical protein